MKRRTFNLKEEYFQSNQVLSSLVLNTPFKVDAFTTAPRVPKILDFPFGLKIDSYILFKSTFYLVSSLALLMTFTCILITCFYLPIQNHNSQLFNSAKSLTNRNLTLLVKMQESSNYNTLFKNASNFTLKDSEETIHINNNTIIPENENTKLLSFNRHPVIQFSGF